jgi:vanillate O-demethylase monooxygenase subunit
MFPLNQWYVAGFSWDLRDKPLARTLLNQPVVLFRAAGGRVAALEDRCCHRSAPLSCGSIEERGIRCGYHGLLFSPGGACIEIPGQLRIPEGACVREYTVEERDQVVWIWMGADTPTERAPAWPWHTDPAYGFKGDTVHYKAPFQLIHDNLLDLSHLGYVHLKTIGGNAAVHTSADMQVESRGDSVRVVRHMPACEPPPTYLRSNFSPRTCTSGPEAWTRAQARSTTPRGVACTCTASTPSRRRRTRPASTSGRSP